MVIHMGDEGGRQASEMLAALKEISSQMPRSEKRRPIAPYLWLLTFILFASVAVSSWIKILD